jgi:hypothetical protein
MPTEKRKAHREEIKQEINAGYEKIQENLNRVLEKIMDTNQAKTDVKLEELIEAMEETRVEREEPTSADRIACQETTVYHEETEAAMEKIEPDSGTLQSVAEHREVPNEYDVVKPVRGRKKRHRGRQQAERRRGVPKKLIRGDCGSRKKLAAACRKVSRHATVAWRKRSIFRKSWTQANCGPRKEVTAADMKVTRYAGHMREEQIKDDVARRSPRGGTFDKKLWRSPECKNGIRSGVVEEPLHLRKGRRNISSIGGWSRIQHPRLNSMGNSIQVFGKAIELQFGKLADGSSVVIRNIDNWTLWRGRPLPQRKRVCIRSRSR